MTYQHGVPGPNDNQIIHSKQCDTSATIIEDDVVAGTERGQTAVGSIAAVILFKIPRYRLPATNIVPIEFRFQHQNAIGMEY